MEESQTRFNFFSLPAELRINIYEHVVSGPGCVQFASIDHDHTGPGSYSVYGYLNGVPPPITQVCRQLRSETLPIHFAKDTKAYVDIEPERKDTSIRIAQLHSWLEAIGPESAALIKNLTIYMPLPNGPCAWTVECNCDDDERGCWRPNSSEDVCFYLGLDQLGVIPSAVRGLFGAHVVDEDEDDDWKPVKGQPWRMARHNFELDYRLWWTPVAGEEHRDGDNGVWQADEGKQDDKEEQERSPVEDP
jgi:hypothetical protein